MTTQNATARKADPRRRAALLDSALMVFVRFGYRKASMDEIARSAGISRQSLYLQFADKQDLFRASIEHHYAGALDAATDALLDKEPSIDAKLLAAFDEWLGRYVGLVEADTFELLADTRAIAGGIMSEHEKRFERVVVKTIAASALAGPYAAAGVTALQLSRTLHATARGIKEVSASREDFVDQLKTALKVLCAPLRISG
jgi:TetR/AcrR family transcriptional regulator of autoinduction and epiphytic fitness